MPPVQDFSHPRSPQGPPPKQPSKCPQIPSQLPSLKHNIPAAPSPAHFPSRTSPQRPLTWTPRPTPTFPQDPPLTSALLTFLQRHLRYPQDLPSFPQHLLPASVPSHFTSGCPTSPQNPSNFTPEPPPLYLRSLHPNLPQEPLFNSGTPLLFLRCASLSSGPHNSPHDPQFTSGPPLTFTSGLPIHLKAPPPPQLRTPHLISGPPNSPQDLQLTSGPPTPTSGPSPIRLRPPHPHLRTPSSPQDIPISFTAPPLPKNHARFTSGSPFSFSTPRLHLRSLPTSLPHSLYT